MEVSIGRLKNCHYQYNYDLLDGRKSEGLAEKYRFASVFSGFAWYLKISLFFGSFQKRIDIDCFSSLVTLVILVIFQQESKAICQLYWQTLHSLGMFLRSEKKFMIWSFHVKVFYSYLWDIVFHNSDELLWKSVLFYLVFQSDFMTVTMMGFSNWKCFCFELSLALLRPPPYYLCCHLLKDFLLKKAAVW